MLETAIIHYTERLEEGRSNAIYNSSTWFGESISVVNLGGYKRLMCQFSIVVNLVDFSRKSK